MFRKAGHRRKNKYHNVMRVIHSKVADRSNEGVGEVGKIVRTFRNLLSEFFNDEDILSIIKKGKLPYRPEL